MPIINGTRRRTPSGPGGRVNQCGRHAAHPSPNPSRVFCAAARPSAHRPFATTVAASPPAPVPPLDLPPVERSRPPPPTSACSPRRRVRYSTPRRSERAARSVRRAPTHAAATHNAAPPLGQTRADPARGKKVPRYTIAMWMHETDTRPVHFSRQAEPSCADFPNDGLPLT